MDSHEDTFSTFKLHVGRLEANSLGWSSIEVREHMLVESGYSPLCGGDRTDNEINLIIVILSSKLELEWLRFVLGCEFVVDVLSRHYLAGLRVE